MGRPLGSKNTGVTLVIADCPDCGKRLGNYRSTKCASCAKTGVPRPDMIGHKRTYGNKYNLGRHLTDEIKGKISAAKKGRSLSPEHRAKISASSKKGAEHHNWNGGNTSADHIERVKFRKRMQQLVFQRDNYTCQICDQYNGNLQVDHIKKWSDYPELRFEIDNCRTLCMACHYYVTFKRKLPQGVIWGHNLSRRIGK